MSREERVRRHAWWEQIAINIILKGTARPDIRPLLCVARDTLQYFPESDCMPRRDGNFMAHAAGRRGNKLTYDKLLLPL